MLTLNVNITEMLAYFKARC